MLILSIPFISTDFVKEHAINNKFTWKEYRLDYQTKLVDFPYEVIDANSIITIRERSVGGVCDISGTEKMELYQKVIDKYNCLVDLELSNYQTDLFPTENLIVSHHEFTENFSYKEIENIVQKLNLVDAKFAKIAVNINSYAQLLEIYDLIQKSNKPIIFAAMGKLGKISRLLYKHLGAVGTFAGLAENQTASGQITEDDLKTYALHRISKFSRIGGIVGGEQVTDSLGLKFYNNLFQAKNQDAFYFPFTIDRIGDFKNWMKKCQFKTRFFGFSITMPFKQKFAENGRNYNLFIPAGNEYFNTDRIAFQAALQQLSVNRDDTILIYGSGGSAETALSELQDYNNVVVCARNVNKKIKSKIISLAEAAGLNIDLLINCTPLGLQNEDFISETGISDFKKVIDLPYLTNDTKLIEFCRSHSLPCVDGKTFWQWQANRQIVEFEKAIAHE